MSTPLTKEARMRSRTGPAGACSGARIVASEPKVVGIITDPDIHVGAMHIGGHTPRDGEPEVTGADDDLTEFVKSASGGAVLDDHDGRPRYALAPVGSVVDT